MGKFSKPTTGAFVLDPAKAEEFFKFNCGTTSKALARANKHHKNRNHIGKVEIVRV